MDDTIRQLAAAIERDKIRQAMETDPGEKLLDGPRLFGQVCRRMEAGLRFQFPDANDDEVRRKLHLGLQANRSMEDAGLPDHLFRFLLGKDEISKEEPAA